MFKHPSGNQAFQLIPALDLKNHRVVRAAGGDRRAYRPLGNARFPSPKPTDVARRLLRQFECRVLYIADIDAITGDGDNGSCIREVAREFPDVDLWLDCGLRTREDFELLQRTYPDATIVVATETLSDAGLPAALRSAKKHFALSLDFGARGTLRGSPEVAKLLEHPEDWPGTVIVLSLSAIGSAAGPDLATLSAVRGKCAGRRLVAGGGVRDKNDLATLRRAGAGAALVANALYTGAIKAYPPHPGTPDDKRHAL